MAAAWVTLDQVGFVPIELAGKHRTSRVTLYVGDHPIAARSTEAMDAAIADREAWLRSPERQAM